MTSPAPACGPFTDGYIVGDGGDRAILPESQSFTHYQDESCLSERPRREAAREEIADYVLLSLGAPMVRVELDRQQLTLCVDEAMKRFEEHASKADYDVYYFNTVPGVPRYKLPCDIGIIKRVDFRSAICGGPGMISLGVDGLAIPFVGSFYYPAAAFGGGPYGFGRIGYGTGAYAGGNYLHANVGEWFLALQYQELFARVAGNEPSWEMAANNTIFLYPTPRGTVGVAVQYLQRKRDWPDVYSWMKDWALAHAKEILGRVRSKYDRYVSPGGGVTLDGQALLSESREDKAKLEEQALYKWGHDHMLPIVG
jgi:hypothetical protein